MFSILENIETYFGYFLIRFYWHKVSYCTTQKRQVFPTYFGGGLFQGNLSNCEFYRFNVTSAIFFNLMTSFSNFSRRGCFIQVDSNEESTACSSFKGTYYALDLLLYENSFWFFYPKTFSLTKTFS